MAFYTRATLRTELTNELPSGVGGASLTTYLNSAIADAVAFAAVYFRDVNKIDFVGDGVTQRFLLPGVDCALVESDAEIYSDYVNTAGVPAPTVSVTPTASGSGSTFLAGLHYFAYSFTTPLGETPITGYTKVTLTAGQNVVIPAITLATNVTGVNYYLSPGPLNADIQLAGSSASGAQQTFTAPPSTTAGRPIVGTYTTLNSLGPVTLLEQDIGVNGAASIGNATLTVTTVPTLGQRFRVSYARNPPVPTQDTDTIRVPEHIIRLEALKFAHRTLAYVHESGDTTQHLDAYAKLDLLSQDMQSAQSPRLAKRPRIPVADYVTAT